MTGQCRLCGELIISPGHVLDAPDPRHAEFAMLSVGAFFHVLQRHQDVAKSSFDLLMGSMSQYAAMLCVQTGEADHEALLSRLRADLMGLIEHTHYSAISKKLVVQSYATDDGAAKPA